MLEYLTPEQRREAEANAAQTASDMVADDSIAQHHASDDEIAAANVRRARRSSMRLAELRHSGELSTMFEEGDVTVAEDSDDGQDSSEPKNPPTIASARRV